MTEKKKRKTERINKNRKKNNRRKGKRIQMTRKAERERSKCIDKWQTQETRFKEKLKKLKKSVGEK